MATGRVAGGDVDGDGQTVFHDPIPPGDVDGDRTMAHEAAHVVQQREASTGKATGRAASDDPGGEGPAEAIGFGLRISGD